jgi:hypothetical protein
VSKEVADSGTEDEEDDDDDDDDDDLAYEGNTCKENLSLNENSNINNGKKLRTGIYSTETNLNEEMLLIQENRVFQKLQNLWSKFFKTAVKLELLCIIQKIMIKS